MSNMLWTYAAIAVGSGLFYALSLVFGGDHHHFDLGHGGGDGHGDHDGDTGFKELFSIRSLLLFGLGFGVTGVLSTSAGLAAPLIPIAGAVMGIFTAFIGIQFFRLLMRQEGTTSNSLTELEGMSGKVSTYIPANGVGEILIRNYRGQAQFIRARAEDGAEIKEGQSVDVVSVAAGDLVVRRANILPSVME